MRNFGTVKSERFEKRTIKTAAFPITASNTTIHTEALSQLEPMTSSHGFKASGTG